MSKNKRKIKVLDLFAGAGGFGLGFRLANSNFKVICSLEVDKWAAETLKANNVEKQKIIVKDIRSFDTDEKIRAACKSKPDIIIGGPPCQGFSYAGPTKDPKDPRNISLTQGRKNMNLCEPWCPCGLVAFLIATKTHE